MNFEEKIIRYRVSVGIIVLVLVFIFAKPTLKSVAFGSLIGLIGVLLRAWASGHLNKNKELTVSGPYKFTRNPLYLGNIIMALGLIINANNRISAILLILYLLIFYPFLIIREKNYLRDRFDNYKDFESVPLLIPNPFKKTWKNRDNSYGFSFDRYIKNREYNALLGLIIITLLFLLKIYLTNI